MGVRKPLAGSERWFVKLVTAGRFAPKRLRSGRVVTDTPSNDDGQLRRPRSRCIREGLKPFLGRDSDRGWPSLDFGSNRGTKGGA